MTLPCLHRLFPLPKYKVAYRRFLVSNLAVFFFFYTYSVMFSVYIVDACEPLKLLSSFSIWARGDLSLWHCCNARPLTSQPAAASLEIFLEEHSSSETFSSIFCFSLAFFFCDFSHACAHAFSTPAARRANIYQAFYTADVSPPI